MIKIQGPYTTNAASLAGKPLPDNYNCTGGKELFDITIQSKALLLTVKNVSK